jgi:hypothetical protein
MTEDLYKLLKGITKVQAEMNVIIGTLTTSLNEKTNDDGVTNKKGIRRSANRRLKNLIAKNRTTLLKIKEQIHEN